MMMHLLRKVSASNSDTFTRMLRFIFRTSMPHTRFQFSAQYAGSYLACTEPGHLHLPTINFVPGQTAE